MQAEKDKRQNENGHRGSDPLVFPVVRDLYYRANLEGQLLAVSPSVTRIGGYEPEELLGKNVGSFVEEEEDKALLQSLMSGQGYVDDYNIVLTRKDGSRIDCSLNAQLVRDVKGIPRYMEGVIRDISRRRSMETELSGFNRQFREISDNLPVILFKLKQNGDHWSMEYASPNLLKRMRAEKASDIRGMFPPEEMMNAEDRNLWQKEMADSLRENRPAELEFQLKRAEGVSEWMRIRMSHWKDGDGTRYWTGIGMDITEETLLKGEMAEKESQLHALYESARAGLSTMSVRGVVTSVNPMILERTGYAEHELVGKHFRELPLFFREDQPTYGTLFKQALTGNLPREGIIFAYRHKNGGKRWGEAFLSLNRSGKKILGFQGVFVDVTAQMQLKESQQQKQEEFDFLFNTTVHLLQVTREEDLFTLISKQLNSLLPDFIVNLNSVDETGTVLQIRSLLGLEGNSGSKIIRQLDKYIQNRTFHIQPDTFQYASHGKLIRSTRSLYDLTLHQVPKLVCEQIESILHLEGSLEVSLGVGKVIMGGGVIFLRKGQKVENPHLVEFLFRQATEALIRLRAANQLSRSEELYRSLAENAQDMILRFDRDLSLIYANRAFQDTFGFPFGAIRGKTVSELGFPGSIGELVQKTMIRTRDRNKPGTCDNVIHIGDAPRFFEWRIFPETDEEGKVHSILVYVHDISNRKSTEARLQESMETKNRVFRLISHDLRNPMNSMLGFLNLLNDKYEDLTDEMKRNYLSTIRDSSQQFFSLLNSLQEWSRGFEQEHYVNPVHFDLRALAEQSLSLFRLNCMEKEIECLNRVPAGTMVRADYNMVFSSLRNFISNAVKFSYPGGHIEVGCNMEKEHVILTVRDNGIGMTEEEVKQLFHKEEVVSREGTRGEKGTGYGFKLALEFIEINQGWVQVKSRPGQGCTIQIGLRRD
ncbi:MAG: PAS domain S-box protein [Bacteroidales bacterium]